MDQKYMCDLVQTCDMKFNLAKPCGPQSSRDFDSGFIGNSDHVIDLMGAPAGDVSEPRLYEHQLPVPFCHADPSSNQLEGRWILPCDFPCSEVGATDDAEMLKWCKWSSAYWKPYKCIYPPLAFMEDWLRSCAMEKSFVFIGDSTIRALFNRLADLMGLETTPLRHHGYFAQMDGSTGIFYNYSLFRNEPIDSSSKPGHSRLTDTLDGVLTSLPPLYIAYPRQVVFVFGSITLDSSHVEEISHWMRHNGLKHYKMIFKSRGYKGSESNAQYIINHHRDIMRTKQTVLENGFTYLDAYNITMSGWHLVEKDSTRCQFARHLPDNPPGHRVVGQANEAILKSLLTQTCFDA